MAIALALGASEQSPNHIGRYAAARSFAYAANEQQLRSEQLAKTLTYKYFS